MKLKNKQEVLWHSHSQNLHDGFINFWQGIFEDVLDPLTPHTKIIEFGSLNSKFLQFAHIHFPYQKATGVLLEIDGDQNPTQWIVPPRTQTIFLKENQLSTYNESHDIAFSQEIFSLISDLELHAKTVWNSLGPNGVYYATFGWHSDNPTTKLQEKLRLERKQPFFNYSLDTIALIFHKVGFEVGFKRLSLPYYMIYEPNLIEKRFGNINQMISGLQDHKILFSFRKWDDIS